MLAATTCVGNLPALLPVFGVDSRPSPLQALQCTFEQEPLYSHRSADGGSRNDDRRAAVLEEIVIELEEQLKALHRQKHSASSSYAHEAEGALDKFLVSHYGFDHEVIPYDYLERPPSDLSLVQSNLDTLMHVAAEVFLPTSLVYTKLVAPFVEHTWRVHLTPLRVALIDLYNKVLLAKGKPLMVIASRSKTRLMLGGGSSGGLPDSPMMLFSNGSLSSPVIGSDSPTSHIWSHGHLKARLHQLIHEIELDLDYMRRIDEMEITHHHSSDAPSSSCGESDVSRGVSDFVTVSGLLIGRIHRLENEHRTVLQHWSR